MPNEERGVSLNSLQGQIYDSTLAENGRTFKHSDLRARTKRDTARGEKPIHSRVDTSSRIRTLGLEVESDGRSSSETLSYIFFSPVS